MNTYKRHRFPPDIISYAVWLYHRFNLSHRDIEDLLAERDIIFGSKAVRIWCRKFGAQYAHRLKRNHQGYGDTFFIDEAFVKIQGKPLNVPLNSYLNAMTPSLGRSSRTNCAAMVLRTVS
jgi:putative transposase